MKSQIKLQQFAGAILRQSLFFLVGPEINQSLAIYIKSWGRRNLLISSLLGLCLVTLLSPEICGSFSQYYAPGIDSPSYNKNVTLPFAPLRTIDNTNRVKRVDFVNRRVDNISKTASIWLANNNSNTDLNPFLVNTIPLVYIYSSRPAAYQLLDIPPPSLS